MNAAVNMVIVVLVRLIVALDAKVDRVVALLLLPLLHLLALVIVPAMNAAANMVIVVLVRLIVVLDAKVDLVLVVLQAAILLLQAVIDLSLPRGTALLQIARKDHAFRALVVQNLKQLAHMGLLQ